MATGGIVSHAGRFVQFEKARAGKSHTRVEQSGVRAVVFYFERHGFRLLAGVHDHGGLRHGEPHARKRAPSIKKHADLFGKTNLLTD